jgi:ATP-dependent RNA helicase SUPV3L1/SUV3
VGKLVSGADAMKPQVQAFVDEEAGDEVADKVRRRLQHFIDRKVAALFEPLLAMSRDEALQGLARGFAFRLVEALGVLPRDGIAEEVKALDQDARGALRKHGVRFGQYTIFLPPLLKPAPTRLRLVLWSLAKGLQEFPESPPPGLVTIPNLPALDPQVYTLAGYRPAGERAIRIDMLERLADLVRAADSRGGFEATPDMLSITGMTLEQFARLMEGLGYAAAKGEREKKKPETASAAETPAEAVTEVPAEPAPMPDAAPAEGETAPADAAAPEMEVFYTFTWAPRRAPRADRPRREHRESQNRDGQNREAQGGDGERPERGPRREGGKPRRDRDEGGKPRHKGNGKGRPDREERPKSFEARPPREKKIDPDNPFAAALMGFKVKE